MRRSTSEKEAGISLMNNKFVELLIDKIDENSETSSNEKGKLLEDLARYVLMTIPGINIRDRIRTNTTELDLLINMNSNFIDINIPSEGYSIAECKNYKIKVSVTYIMKFIRLLEINHLSLGFFFTWEGVSKPALKEIRRAVDTNGIYVIAIDKKHIRKSVEQGSFLPIIIEEYEKLRFDLTE